MFISTHELNMFKEELPKKYIYIVCLWNSGHISFLLLFLFLLPNYYFPPTVNKTSQFLSTKEKKRTPDFLSQ